MEKRSSFTKTVGPVSAKFVSELQKQGKSIFTLDDAVRVYGKERQKTTGFLSTLVKRGIIARIKSGVYLIFRMGHENAQLDNWPTIARELVSSNDYYISHYSAMRLHGMTVHPLTDVYITMSKRRMTKKIDRITYHFIYSKPEHFWGKESHWANKQDKVNISDIERTLLDGLSRPDLCGGIKEVIRGIWTKKSEMDWDKLVQYATNFHTKAATKRLGFILEILGCKDEHLCLLAQTIASAKDYILLDPHGPKCGRHSTLWRLRLNIDIGELKASIWG